MKTRLICLSSERYKTVSVVGTSRCDVRAACSGATLSNCRCHSVIRSARYYAGGDGVARRPYHRARCAGIWFIEMGTPEGGARTVPVRSAWAGRGDLEKGDVFGRDDPLRTGTVRGPMRRD